MKSFIHFCNTSLIHFNGHVVPFKENYKEKAFKFEPFYGNYLTTKHEGETFYKNISTLNRFSEDAV